MEIGGHTVFVPHEGPAETTAVILMGLVTGIFWWVGTRRRRGGHG